MGGYNGKLLSSIICKILNINNNNNNQQQEILLKTNMNFIMIGGDSLSATRIVRTLYSIHYNLDNDSGRILGGKYGILDDEIFHVKYLLSICFTLADYVDFLDRNGVCISNSDS